MNKIIVNRILITLVIIGILLGLFGIIILSYKLLTTGEYGVFGRIGLIVLIGISIVLALVNFIKKVKQ